MLLNTAERNAAASDLRSLFQWPEEPPDVAPFMHGWFFGQDVLRQFCGPDTSLIVELGSWMGKSAQWFCRRCPNALVICVDHWEGSPDLMRQWSQFVPKSHALFLANLWQYRDRVVPLRMRSVDGIEALAQHECSPDLVYIDAAHDEQSVRADVLACRAAFPDARLVGDDWNMESVKRGVRSAIDIPIENDWRFWWTT